ncbi:MAG: hypothetical protein ABH879_10430 [archaeon]
MSDKLLIHKFKESSDLVYDSEDYTSATILYFKTLFAIHDFILLKKIGTAPKDHTERFRLLKKEYPDSYELLDSEFNTYRSTYNRIISKETCERIKRLVEDELKKI